MKLLLSFLIVAVSVSLAPLAGAANSRIDRIKSTGVIPIGYRPSAVPFSYLNDSGKPIGYSIDICHGIVDALKKDLNMPDLKIKLVQVTPATRIPLVDNGTIDLSCGSSMNSKEREKLVSFTPTIFFVQTGRFAALKKSHLNDLQDLKGKTVAATAGSSNVKVAHKLNSEFGLGMDITTAQTHAAAFLSVGSGRASAIFEDDVLLAGLIAGSRNPDAWMISKKAYGAEVYGLIEPKNDQQFKTYVNDAVKAMMKSGKITELYAKWFTKPIPPNNINMKWPMSEKLKWAIQHPMNSPNPADYK